MKKYKNTILILLGIFLINGCAMENKKLQTKGLSVSSSKNTNSIKKQALVVGISDYAGLGSDLNGIDRDVEKMKKLFTKWGFEVKVLYDKDSLEIINYLTSYGNTLNANDMFAFYYTGHGSHKKDENHDEDDGEDETLVLSDGTVNKHLTDDILYTKFNEIKAKKLIFFDSCHSGTVFRSLSGKAQAKTMKPEDITESLSLSSSKGLNVGKDSIDSGEYIVFSSSQDTEESLATPTGSLFTNSLAEVFSDSILEKKSLNEINKILTTKVVNYAKETDGKAHHPSIHYSSSVLGTKSLDSFISKKSSLEEPLSTPTPTPTPISTSSLKTKKTETVQSTLDTLLKSESVSPLSLDYTQTNYKNGESVEFSIDTKGEKGYLTIFYVDSNDVTILYPNEFVSSKELEGKYSFPKDFSNGKFELEAYKACGDCKEEKTTVYTLLSSSPVLDIKSLQSKGGLASFKKSSTESKQVTRAIRLKATTKEAIKPQMGKYEFIVR